MIRRRKTELVKKSSILNDYPSKWPQCYKIKYISQTIYVVTKTSYHAFYTFCYVYNVSYNTQTLINIHKRLPSVMYFYGCYSITRGFVMLSAQLYWDAPSAGQNSSKIGLANMK